MADDRKFKFISPGVFINEIDNSQLPATSQRATGPLVIGTAPKGPAGEPVTVNSFSDLIEKFGPPQAGDPAVDAWRFGQQTAPTYGLYAAQAWLRNNAPLTYMRLLGEEHPDRILNTGSAGWKAGGISTKNGGDDDAGGAYALCIFPNVDFPDDETGTGASLVPLTGAVAAIIYCKEGSLLLSGTLHQAGTTVTASCSRWMRADAEGNFDIAFLPEGDDARIRSAKVHLNPERPNFIRNVLNTNPVLTNTTVAGNAARSSSFGGMYWLGESFERQINYASTGSMGVMSAEGKGDDLFSPNTYVNTTSSLVLLPMRSQVNNSDQASDHQYGSVKASTGWVIAQDLTVGQNTS